MCSQADDPSQHVSDDTLRAALTTIKRGCLEHHWTDAPDDEEAWYCPSCGVTEYPNGPTLAASATDEDYTAAAGMMRVTAEDIRASLRALGPTGDRAEAIVRAAAESVAVELENRLAASATDEGRPDHCPGCDGNHA